MRSRLVAATLTLILAGGSAQAGWFGGQGKAPKAVDSPVVRPKVKEAHKAAAHMPLMLGKYGSPTWGARWDAGFKHTVRPLKPYLH